MKRFVRRNVNNQTNAAMYFFIGFTSNLQHIQISKVCTTVKMPAVSSRFVYLGNVYNLYRQMGSNELTRTACLQCTISFIRRKVETQRNKDHVCLAFQCRRSPSTNAQQIRTFTNTQGCHISQNFFLFYRRCRQVFWCQVRGGCQRRRTQSIPKTSL